ncbi:unnamed protein product [Caenorhabditis auriculariae]|uniref:Uncharacterized protein n=1 Tax=Caenorhabditis auriculariae TaxID=2777116 RepID=A0A8S1H3G8_9PELO|nr:unnamed protein product [Caenorhabditis auriculariae]
MNFGKNINDTEVCIKPAIKLMRHMQRRSSRKLSVEIDKLVEQLKMLSEVLNTMKDRMELPDIGSLSGTSITPVLESESSGTTSGASKSSSNKKL